MHYAQCIMHNSILFKGVLCNQEHAFNIFDIPDGQSISTKVSVLNRKPLAQELRLFSASSPQPGRDAKIDR